MEHCRQEPCSGRSQRRNCGSVSSACRGFVLALALSAFGGGCALVGYDPLTLDEEAAGLPTNGTPTMDPPAAAPPTNSGEPPAAGSMTSTDAGFTTPMPVAPSTLGMDGGTPEPMPSVPPGMDGDTAGDDAGSGAAPDAAVVDAAIDPPLCVPNSARCDGDRFIECNDLGDTETTTDCSQGLAACQEGSCDAQGCGAGQAAPDLTQCNGGAGACLAGSCVPADVCALGVCDSACSAPGDCTTVCTDDATCNQQCTGQSTCTAGCADRSQCDVTCDAASCDLRCEGSANCGATCSQGAVCEVTCTGNSDCSNVRCESGSACTIKCQGGANCGFDTCHGTPQTCPDGIIVCDQFCP